MSRKNIIIGFLTFLFLILLVFWQKGFFGLRNKLSESNNRDNNEKVYAIGYFHYNQILSSIFSEFKKSMDDLAQKNNFKVSYSMVGSQASDENFQRAATEFNNGKVDIIVTGQAAYPAMRSENPTVPIIVAYLSDVAMAEKIKQEAVDSNVIFIDSGGNTVAGDRLLFIPKIMPNVKTVLVLRGSDNNVFSNSGAMQPINEAATANNLTIIEKTFDNRENFNKFFLDYDFSAVDAIFRYPDPFITANLDILLSMARQRRVFKAVIVRNRTELEAGGLLAYGTNTEDFGETAAKLAYGVLIKNINPTDVPIQRPYNFQLGINKITAQFLGIQIPTSLINQADYIIE